MSAITPTGLDPADIVNVTVSLSALTPTAASQNIPLIIGPSDVIDVTERIRTYSGGATALTTIAAQFGTTAPEYLMAQQFFEKTPQPQVVKIGRWADGATSALLHGIALSNTQQQLSNFTSITTGSLTFNYGAGATAAVTVTGINLSSATSLPGVATLITTTAAGGVTVKWNALYSRFDVETIATGATQIITGCTTPGSGTDISTLLGIKSTQAVTSVAGTAGETPLAALTILRGMDKGWYFGCISTLNGGVWSGTDANLTTAAYVAMASFIEACSPSSTFGITSSDPNCLLSSSTTDVMAAIQAGGYHRTTVYYSSTNPGVALEMFAKFAVIDYTQSDVATTAMFTNLPGVVAETLTEVQAATITSKYGNVFVNYDNGVAIVQNGQMGSGNYFDEIHGTDAFAATLQNLIFSQLVTQSTTYKVPQTNAGMQLLTTVASQAAEQFVEAGVIGRNLVWNGPPIGQLATGQVLPKGFYCYQAPLSQQSVSARQARQAPALQIAINLAGAVQSASAAITVTR